MKKTQIFSIVTVTLDNLAGLKRTGESLKNQSFQGFEWIVIDGASRDGTVDYLNNSNTCWISEADSGIYDAMNKGLARAQGEYVLFLNAGDALAARDTLEKIAAQMEKQNERPDFVYGDSLEGGARKPARAHGTRDWGMFTHHQAMIYRRGAIGMLRYDLRHEIAADYEFTCRFLESARRVLYCPFPICVFEPGGVSQRRALQGRREQFAARKNLGCGAAKNALIFCAQSLAWNFRRALPRAYWLLKSSGNSRSGSART